MEEIKKRIRRTPEQRAEEVDAKIQTLKQELEAVEEKRTAVNQELDNKTAAIKEKIAAQEQKKKDILSPKRPSKPRRTKKQKIKELIDFASKSGLKPEEIAQRLGLEPSEE